MIEATVLFLEKILVPYGALGVFAASFTEEVIAPIPSAIVLLASGFFFLHGEPFSLFYLYKLFFIIVIPASIGMTLGSLFIYSIGYWSGKPAIVRFGKYFGISWSDVEKVEKRFDKSSADEVTIFFLRALPVVPNTAVSALCGLIRFPVLKYFFLSMGGLSLRALVLAFIGGKVGSVYYNYGFYMEKAENFILFGLIIVMAGIFLALYYRRGLSHNKKI